MSKTGRPNGKLPPDTEHMIEMMQFFVREQVMAVTGVDPEIAKMVADEVATKFFAQFGGAMHYLPSGKVFRSSKLHREVWKAYDGKGNYRELQKKFGLSLPHIYVIVKREAARVKADSQGTIPGLET